MRPAQTVRLQPAGGAVPIKMSMRPIVTFNGFSYAWLLLPSVPATMFDQDAYIIDNLDGT